MKSWKIGAVSGLIAGFISGIIGFLTAIVLLRIGLPYFIPPQYVSVSMITSVHICIGIVVGVISGVIYSKVLDVIPGTYILKGLIFGLFLYSIFALRFATIELSYARFSSATAFTMYLFVWIVLGLVIGILYEVLARRNHIPKGKKVIEYRMVGGLLPGAIAGLIGGMATFFTIVIGVVTGFWAWIPKQIADIGFLISQFGAQTFFHFVWCVFMGIIFPKVYNIVPGKGIIKGLYYGLMTFIITEGFSLLYGTVYYYYLKPQEPLVAEYWLFALKQATFLGLTVWIVFGLVLGYLYKPAK